MAAAKSLIPNTKSERQPLGSPQMKSIGKRSYHFAQSQKCMGPYKCCSSLQQACFFSWANLRLCSFSSRSLSDATFPSRKFRSPILPVCLVWYKSEPWNVWLFELKKKKSSLSSLIHEWFWMSQTDKEPKNQLPTLWGFFLQWFCFTDMLFWWRCHSNEWIWISWLSCP